MNKFTRDSLREAMLQKEDHTVEFLDTGCILLNLACSQQGRTGGIPRGRISNFVGDGSSGKTLTALEVCAQAFYHVKKRKTELYPSVKKVNIVYNNVEGVMDLPINRMYGKKFVKGIDWKQTSTCEKFGRDFLKRCYNHKEGEFLLYVLDSVDALMPESHKKKVDKSIKSDEEIEEGFGAEKARYFSKTFFKTLCSAMIKKDITLICISQIREKIGVVFGKKHYRTGGKAMDFYTHCVPWFAEKKKLKAHEKIYGVDVKVNIERSKVALPFRIVDFPIIFNYGIDNIGSMVNFLYGESDEIEWRDAKKYNRKAFIKFMEDDLCEYNLLVNMTEARWFDVEKKAMPERKMRFE